MPNNPPVAYVSSLPEQKEAAMAMSGRRMKRRGEAARLEMTPMIDVVFLLLVFFVITISPRDILSKLNVSRPQAGGGDDIPMLRVEIASDGYTINGRKAQLALIEKRLAKLVSISPRQSLIVACSPDSEHSGLVRLLDVCEKVKLRNVSLFSM